MSETLKIRDQVIHAKLDFIRDQLAAAQRALFQLDGELKALRNYMNQSAEVCDAKIR